MKNLLLFIFLILPLFSFAQSKRAHKKEIKKFREHYKQEFLDEERSPFYGNAEGMDKMRFYKAKRKYKVVGTFQRTSDAAPFKMATYSGDTQDYVLYGIVNVLLHGEKLAVHVYQNLRLRDLEEYKDYLFVPFKDETNGETTYGGGRYIDLRIGDLKDGKVTLDFNRSYNPWCAFSDGYSCPVPPRENHFELEILAGEKNFEK